MLLNTYVAVLLWILAIFGAVMLAVRIISAVGWLKRGARGRCSVLITAQNDQENIEGIIRWLMLNDPVERGEDIFDGRIIVVDNGSVDDTPGILSRLARQYPRLRVIKAGDLKGSSTEFIN